MRLNCSARRLVNLLGNRRMKIHSDRTQLHAQIIFYLSPQEPNSSKSIESQVPHNSTNNVHILSDDSGIWKEKLKRDGC